MGSRNKIEVLERRLETYQKYVVGTRQGQRVYASWPCRPGTNDIYHDEIAGHHRMHTVEGGGRVRMTTTEDKTLLELYDRSGRYGRPSPKTLKQLKTALEQAYREQPNLEVRVSDY